MTWVQLLILAIVQGLTEFIPVSSSAHLILAPALIDGWADQGRAIDVAAHVGSLGAVLIYFRQETASLFRGGIHTLTFTPSDDRRLFLMIAMATIPLVVFGGALAVTGIADLLRDPVVIGIASIGFGILLWIADRRPTDKDVMPNTWMGVMTIGVAQALATIPGTSRSGITVTAARFLGYSRSEAARFSMLMAIPAIMASGAFEALKMASEGAEAQVVPALVVAAFSFLAAWAAIAAFMALTRRIDFTFFVIYRVILGIVLILAFT